MIAEIITRLETLGLPVGFTKPPDEGGWDEGTPNYGTFTPYMVVTPGATTTADDTLDVACQMWSAQFMVRCWGVDPRRLEELARQANDTLHGFTLSTGRSVFILSWGAHRRDSSTSPATLWMDLSGRFRLS